MIAQDQIQAVKESPILRVIGHYLPLRKKGVNHIGPCPFHDERTPSFVVSPSRNRYKCFGCGEAGDAIHFVMKHEGKNFPDAAKIAGSILGIYIDSEIPMPKIKPNQFKKQKIAEFNTVPAHLVLGDVSQIHTHSLTKQFCELVGDRIVKEALSLYTVSIEGAQLTIPQFDISGNCRTAKIIGYGNGAKRVSVPQWLHRTLIDKKLLPENFKLKQCFTGEHLLSKARQKSVAIVESQSTMLLMACLGLAAECYHIEHLKYFNSFIWLSTGGVNGVSWKDETVSSVLRGRQVILFPDAGFYEHWAKDAEVMRQYGIYVGVSDLLEKKYNNGQLKYNDDLRDYFLQYSEEIKKSCQNAITRIEIEDMLPGSVVMKTGEEYGNLISASFWLKDGRFVDVLYDKNGELVLFHPAIKPISKFFNKKFIPGKLDGQDCLLNLNN